MLVENDRSAHNYPLILTPALDKFSVRLVRPYRAQRW